MANKISYAFGEAGDLTTVADQSTGTEVSFESGWSSAYTLAATEAGYRYMDRAEHNYLWNVVTGNVKEWQEQLAPEHQSTTDYAIGMITMYSSAYYKKIANDNGAISDPSTNSDWEEFSFSNAESAVSVSGTGGALTQTLTELQDIVDNAVTDSAHSFTSNGYQTLSNGLIIQWGESSSTSVTFPIAFTTACLNVVATNISTSFR